MFNRVILGPFRNLPTHPKSPSAPTSVRHYSYDKPTSQAYTKSKTELIFRGSVKTLPNPQINDPPVRSSSLKIFDAIKNQPIASSFKQHLLKQTYTEHSIIGRWVVNSEVNGFLEKNFGNSKVSRFILRHVTNDSQLSEKLKFITDLNQIILKKKVQLEKGPENPSLNKPYKLLFDISKILVKVKSYQEGERVAVNQLMNLIANELKVIEDSETLISQLEEMLEFLPGAVVQQAEAKATLQKTLGSLPQNIMALLQLIDTSDAHEFKVEDYFQFVEDLKDNFNDEEAKNFEELLKEKNLTPAEFFKDKFTNFASKKLWEKLILIVALVAAYFNEIPKKLEEEINGIKDENEKIIKECEKIINHYEELQIELQKTINKNNHKIEKLEHHIKSDEESLRSIYALVSENIFDSTTSPAKREKIRHDKNKLDKLLDKQEKYLEMLGNVKENYKKMHALSLQWRNQLENLNKKINTFIIQNKPKLNKANLLKNKFATREHDVMVEEAKNLQNRILGGKEDPGSLNFHIDNFTTVKKNFHRLLLS